MSGKFYTFDTNILFYAVDPNAGTRHAQAERMIDLADPFRTVLILQTLGELCFSVGRKQPKLLPIAQAVVNELVDTFKVEAASVADLRLANAARQQHGLSFWDAMLWATAKRASCALLFTEDFQDGRTVEGVTFRNPFTMSQKELAALL